MSATRNGSDAVIPFLADDGHQINLIHVESDRAPTRGPVLLVHGAGVRANIFRAPVNKTIVDCLVGEGYDVWLLNWRASIDLPPNEWNLDQAAAYDHPAAVRKVIEETGADSLQAIVHCQGSTSFVMSAVAGLLPGVTTIVSNAVSLHPRILSYSAMKLHGLIPLVSKLTPYLNPAWGDSADDFVSRAVAAIVRLTHHECDNDVCKGVSFTYPTGFPSLWSHDLINDATHEWVRQEFAECPLTFFRQMSDCVRRGHMVSVSGLPELPRDFTARPPQTDARFVFVSGEENPCFLPESQIRSFEFLDTHRPGYHSLHVVPRYGHLDIFMGEHADRDVFPLILKELE